MRRGSLRIKDIDDDNEILRFENRQLKEEIKHLKNELRLMRDKVMILPKLLEECGEVDIYDHDSKKPLCTVVKKDPV